MPPDTSARLSPEMAEALGGPDFHDDLEVAAMLRELGIALLEAPANWLATLPGEFTRREIRAVPLREAYALRRPVFVKSPNDKGITARVYADGSRLPVRPTSLAHLRRKASENK